MDSEWLDNGFRKRGRQQSFQDDDSDLEEESNADSKEFGGKKGAMKGQFKQNHSEIEKRRRDKMNNYINELSSMIPMCNAMSRKLDKLTVLRMAVQHMRALRGGSNTVSESNYKPAFLSDEDLKNLVLESAGGFLVVVGCDRGRILYVSDSVHKVLSQPQSDLVGQNFFDLVHSKDIAAVKEQVSYFDSPSRDKPTEKDVSMATKNENKQVPKQMCSGARRSFICRMKSGTKAKKSKGSDDGNSEFFIMNRKAKLKTISGSSDKKKYVIVNFTGYLKSWPPSGLAIEEDDEEHDSKNLSCLIAVGREVDVADANSTFDNQSFPKEFVSRHSIDGKFIHVDQRITSICGYLPQEILGFSAYDFFHPHDLEKIAQAHKNTLISCDSYTVTYRFLCKAGHYIYLKSKSTNFRNPWTKELEFIMCVNMVDTSRPSPVVTSNIKPNIIHQRPILPAQKLPVSASSVTDNLAPDDHKSVKEVIETLQEGKQGTFDIRHSTEKVIKQDSDSVSDSEASKIGSFIAELGQDQASVQKNRSPHAVLGSHMSNQTSSLSAQFQQSSSLAPPMSNILNPNQPGTSSTSNIAPSFPPPAPPGMPEISQPHLLEQLIGMQQAIESMESPMQQNEETMALFMNMLEADAGLGGDLNDILFQSN